MALRDMMAAFELYQPTSVEGALELLNRFGPGAWLLAGGYDSLNGFKDRRKRPTAVIDLDGIEAMRGIREGDGGLEIGALTTLTEVATDGRVQGRFALLADAARAVASPQIRNGATLGGNVCQDTWCWYYRDGHPCYRAGGNICYADTPVGVNREHAIFGADRCVAVSPSDTAPALVALDARMVVRSSAGEREISAGEFFMSPALDITRMTVLDAGDLLTSIRIPGDWAGADFYFEKVADRKSWDFALLNIAAAVRRNGTRVEDLRLVCGAAACVPLRLTRAEDEVRGRTIDDRVVEAAAAAAVEGARPLRYNGYKVPLTGNLVRRALRSE